MSNGMVLLVFSDTEKEKGKEEDIAASCGVENLHFGKRQITERKSAAISYFLCVCVCHLDPSSYFLAKLAKKRRRKSGN